MALPGDLADDLRELVDRLTLLEHGRQALVDSLWARMPSYVVEDAYAASAASLIVNPQTTQLERITSIIATLPASATGLLQLGPTTIPLGEGITILAGVGFLLSTTATRELVSTVTGPMALVLMGEVVPQWGSLT